MKGSLTLNSARFTQVVVSTSGACALDFNGFVTCMRFASSAAMTSLVGAFSQITIMEMQAQIRVCGVLVSGNIQCQGIGAAH